jgi:hypothetical protein
MKFTFTGCSFTVGEGLPQEKNNLHNYTNIVAGHYLERVQVSNLAQSGNSNYNIFITSLKEILFDTPDILFVQWTSLNRLWAYPKPDAEITLSLGGFKDFDFEYRDLYFPKKEIRRFTEMYHLLNCNYKNILTLVDYCKILETVSQGRCRVVFINGLVPWTRELLTNIHEDFYSQLSNYTKEILDFSDVSDEKLDQLYNQLSDAVQSLDQTKWVNMFESMMKNKLDVGTDNDHPGINSHKQYAKKIINYLEEHNGN